MWKFLTLWVEMHVCQYFHCCQFLWKHPFCSSWTCLSTPVKLMSPLNVGQAGLWKQLHTERYFTRNLSQRITLSCSEQSNFYCAWQAPSCRFTPKCKDPRFLAFKVTCQFFLHVLHACRHTSQSLPINLVINQIKQKHNDTKTLCLTIS